MTQSVSVQHESLLSVENWHLSPADNLVNPMTVVEN